MRLGREKRTEVGIFSDTIYCHDIYSVVDSARNFKDDIRASRQKSLGHSMFSETHDGFFLAPIKKKKLLIQYFYRVFLKMFRRPTATRSGLAPLSATRDLFSSILPVNNDSNKVSIPQKTLKYISSVDYKGFDRTDDGRAKQIGKILQSVR